MGRNGLLSWCLFKLFFGEIIDFEIFRRKKLIFFEIYALGFLFLGGEQQKTDATSFGRLIISLEMRNFIGNGLVYLCSNTISGCRRAGIFKLNRKGSKEVGNLLKKRKEKFAVY